MLQGLIDHPGFGFQTVFCSVVESISVQSAFLVASMHALWAGRLASDNNVLFMRLCLGHAVLQGTWAHVSPHAVRGCQQEDDRWPQRHGHGGPKSDRCELQGIHAVGSTLCPGLTKQRLRLKMKN